VRAIRYHGGRDLRLEDVTAPSPGTQEVLIDVAACGVCGSDLHFLDGTAATSRTPITLGHEIAGTVAASRHDDWNEGDAVVVAAGISCDLCSRCLEGRPNLCERVQMTGIDFDGGWAEQVVVPGRAVMARPPDLDVAAAAVAVDAGATALHAIVGRGGVEAGMSVAIIGVGGLGSFALQIAKMLGAVPLIAVDTDLAALERASALGADVVINAAESPSVGREIKLATEGGVDVAAEFVGAAATVDAAVKSIRKGGVAVATGIGNQPLTTLPPTVWAMSEYELRGSFGSLAGDSEQVLEWLAAGTIVPPPLAPVAIDEAPARIIEEAAGPRSRLRLVVVPG
jgi:propanol-preferring alcohol dehydrogenase